MEIPADLLIIVGFIIVVLGIGAGMLLGALNEDGGSNADDAVETPPGGRRGRYAPLARIWRERDSAALLVEMDGKTFLGPAALSDAQREQMEQAARDLRAWLGMGLAAQPQGAPGPEPSNRPAAASTPAPLSAPAAPATVSPTRTAAAAPIEAGLKEDAPTPVGRSIVMQIEDVLQDMIAGTPLEQRSVHLLEDPGRGVQVMVGLQRFDGIESVTDLEARAAIRAAVEAWEKTQ